MKASAKILVVDDDPNLRKTLADILRIKGYDPVIAGSGAEAVAAAERENVSLALIDLMLPDMTGLEVMARIKVVSPLSEAIILTGHASMDTAIKATKQGAFSYLLKPYQMDDLLLNIRHGVERRQAQEEIIRLASHPRLNPNPVVELSPAGEITYVNPAAESLFPDLVERGREHPLLAGIDSVYNDLQASKQHDHVREVLIVSATYEQHISYVQEVNLIRIHILDISKRKQAEAAVAARERAQAAVAELGTLALTGLDLPAVNEKAATLVAQTLGVEHSMIFDLMPDKTLLLRTGMGWSPALYGKFHREVTPNSLAAFVLAANEPVRIDDMRTDARFDYPELLAGAGVISGVSLTVGARENAFGILSAFATSKREFTIDDVHFMQAIANVLAAAVQRKRTEEEIHALATTDSLTGLANRRAFTAIIEREIDRAHRYGSNLALIMYDIDHFKSVNDCHGHDVGDQVLRAVTELVKKSVRTVDVVARWGGEEFMALLPAADLAAAKIVAEKLRAAIAGHRFETLGSLTASFGVTVYKPDDNMNTLSKRVDDALYIAKENGRNCVEALAD